ncbi:ATP-binding protein, partial [Streptosporangium sp. NPDC051022]
GHSAVVRGMEQGRDFGLADLEPGALEALGVLLARLDGQGKDWERFGRQAVQFHLRNAEAWANRATGEDLAAQIDPDFVFGPEVSATSHSAA